MEKLTLGQLRDMSDKWKKAVIVFDSKSWKKEYPLDSRSYEISRNNKYFEAFANGNSLFGSALDGSDNDVRLDRYMHDWIIDYCYITEHNE